MNKNKFGEIIYTEDDLIEALYLGSDLDMSGAVADFDMPASALDILEHPPKFSKSSSEDMSVEEYDQVHQNQWFMPDKYKNMDIARYILDLCNTEAELQRVGDELLLFYNKGLFDLLKYLVYLRDVMEENKIIWGVGRGSSVASYVLFLLRIHRIDSIYYNLDIEEFLR